MDLSNSVYGAAYNIFSALRWLLVAVSNNESPVTSHQADTRLVNSPITDQIYCNRHIQRLLPSPLQVSWSQVRSSHSYSVRPALAQWTLG